MTWIIAKMGLKLMLAPENKLPLCTRSFRWAVLAFAWTLVLYVVNLLALSVKDGWF